MRRLSSLGSKSLAHRKGRSVLTGAGIVLGVAILFGVLVSNATTQRGVDLLIEDFTGRADVVGRPTGAFDATLPKGTIETLGGIPDVRVVVGDYGFGSQMRIPSTDTRTGVGVAGIRLDEARRIQNYELVAGRPFRDGARELIVSERLLESDDLEGLRLGSRVQVLADGRAHDMTVVGILSREGAGRAGEGHITYTSLRTARTLSGKPGAWSGASVILDDGVDTDRWIERHEAALPGIRLQNAESLAEGFKRFLGTFGTFLTFFAAIVLFIGAFLIYLTLSMAVVERTRMYGTLRALGATRAQVRRIVLLEAVALGAVSSIVGLGLGLLLAKGLLALISSLFDLDLPGLVIGTPAIVAALLVGLVITAGSALVPAVRAGRLQPVVAMKGDHASEVRLGRGWIAGLVVLVGSITLAFAATGPESNAGSLGVIGILLGAVLMVPLLLRPLASLLGRLTNRMSRGVGEIAVLHLAKERSRSAYTLALVMVVMAMLFATGGLFLTVRNGVDEIIDRQFGADLFIESQTELPDGFGATLAERPDIERTSPIWFGSTQVYGTDGEPDDAFVRILDPQSYFHVTSYFWKDGDDASAREALSRGGAVLLPGPLAEDLDVGRGDEVTLFTSTGKVEFDVAGTYINDPGPPQLTMGIRDARRYLSAGRPAAYIATVADGVDPEAAQRSLEDDFERTVPLEIETVTGVKAEARSQVGQYFQILYAILLIAAIVGLLGLANTLAMSVLRRFREIGILRALGTTRSQVWRMVLVESATMGLAAFVLSLPLGFLLSGLVIRDTSRAFGFDMTPVYPWAWIPAVAAFGLVVAVLAAIAPGRRAARLEVVGALQYE